MSHFLKKIKQRYFTKDGDTLYFAALKRVIFIFVLFVFFLGIGILTWIKFIQKQGGKIKVPNLTDTKLLDATEILQKRRLNLKIIPVIKNNVPKYTIVQQNPAAGTTVRENRVIEVVVSSGQIFSRMPSFKGKSLYKVKQLFLGQTRVQGMGKLILKKITYAPSDAPVNTIIAQTPKPDSPIKSDVPVYLVVSNGVNHKVFNMPDYSGKYFYKAVKELEFKDLYVIVKSTKSDESKKARVISQTPARGARISQGDTVTLTVGTGSETKIPMSAKIISYIVPKTDKTENEVKIVLSDDGNDSILFHGSAVAGEKIIQAVMVRGTARVKIFLNKKTVKDETL